MKSLFVIFFFPMILFSQEIRVGEDFIVPRVGYSYHFKTSRNVGFVGLDYITKPDYVGANVFAGVNMMQYQDRLKVIPEAGASVNLLFTSISASVSTESFQPMLGWGLLNLARIEGGYSFRFQSDTPFQGWFLRLYVNNFFDWKMLGM